MENNKWQNNKKKLISMVRFISFIKSTDWLENPHATNTIWTHKIVILRSSCSVSALNFNCNQMKYKIERFLSICMEPLLISVNSFPTHYKISYKRTKHQLNKSHCFEERFQVNTKLSRKFYQIVEIFFIDRAIKTKSFIGHFSHLWAVCLKSKAK